MRRAFANGNGVSWVSEKRLTDLDHTSDLCITAESVQDMKFLMEVMAVEGGKIEPKINIKENKSYEHCQFEQHSN